MKNNYRHSNTTVSLINYHFVFCPKYRHKIFLIPNVEKRFKELVKIKCKELDIEIIAIECNEDPSYIFKLSSNIKSFNYYETNQRIYKQNY